MTAEIDTGIGSTPGGFAGPNTFARHDERAENWPVSSRIVLSTARLSQACPNKAGIEWIPQKANTSVQPPSFQPAERLALGKIFPARQGLLEIQPGRFPSP